MPRAQREVNRGKREAARIVLLRIMSQYLSEFPWDKIPLGAITRQGPEDFQMHKMIYKLQPALRMIILLLLLLILLPSMLPLCRASGGEPASPGEIETGVRTGSLLVAVDSSGACVGIVQFHT